MRSDGVADPAQHDDGARRRQPAAQPEEDSGRGLPDVPTEPDGALCVICGSPSTTSPADPIPAPAAGSEATGLPDQLPPVQLCDEHWSQYRSDWLLLGWCVDHYGEALRYCNIHRQEIQPI
jgi:hypothetical protein